MVNIQIRLNAGYSRCWAIFDRTNGAETKQKRNAIEKRTMKKKIDSNW